MHFPRISFLPFLVILMLLPSLGLAQYQPRVAFVDAMGRMNYERDVEGNRIPDFSYAGYRGGGVDLPRVPTVRMIDPIAGDNTAHVQAAIDSVSRLTPDSSGFRGALLLNAGRYEIHGILRVSTSGVVLRGVGDGADTATNTVLIGVGNTPNQRDLVIVGGNNPSTWSTRVSGTPSFITSDRVLVGENSFKVERPENYAVGDNVVINHPCTQAWIDAIGGGGGVAEGPWAVGSQPLIFNRRVVAIE
ncbi:MAG: peptidoglycan-binding protein, partial [Bacteroidota bacterium]